METILKDHARHLINIDLAPDNIDRTQATDMTVNVKGTSIALRVREPSCKFRDFTVRSTVKSGNKTELDKLKEGYGDIYLYGWGDGKDRLLEYIILDIHQLRRSGLLDRTYIERPNGDGSKFIAIDLLELKLNDCILEYELAPGTINDLNRKYELNKKYMEVV